MTKNEAMRITRRNQESERRNKMTHDEMQEWIAFCQQATTTQLRNIITKEREAGRKPEALLTEMVLKQREEN